MRFVKISSANGGVYYFATTPGFDHSLPSLLAQYQKEHRPENLQSFCNWLVNTMGLVSIITREEIPMAEAIDLPF